MGNYSYSPRLRRDIRATGWFQILCGIASVAFGVRSTVVESPGWPIFGGVFVAVGGLVSHNFFVDLFLWDA